VFKIGASDKETILHNFEYTKKDRAPSGGWPDSGVVSYDNGVLYGTTSGGGDHEWCTDGCGVVFRVER